MADHEHGKMDISEQEAGYDAFIRWLVRSSIAIAVIVLLMYAFLA